jgi:hypothetical protein
MKKHPFDSVSFIFGMLFLLGGLPLLVSDTGLHFFEYRWVFPTFLVIAGLVVLVTSQFTDRNHDEDADDGTPIR